MQNSDNIGFVFFSLILLLPFFFFFRFFSSSPFVLLFFFLFFLIYSYSQVFPIVSLYTDKFKYFTRTNFGVTLLADNYYYNFIIIIINVIINVIFASCTQFSSSTRRNNLMRVRPLSLSLLFSHAYIHIHTRTYTFHIPSLALFHFFSLTSSRFMQTRRDSHSTCHLYIYRSSLRVRS